MHFMQITATITSTCKFTSQNNMIIFVIACTDTVSIISYPVNELKTACYIQIESVPSIACIIHDF